MKNLMRAVAGAAVAAVVSAALMLLIQRLLPFEPLRLVWWYVLPIGGAGAALILAVMSYWLLMRFNVRQTWPVYLVAAVAGLLCLTLYLYGRYRTGLAALPDGVPAADFAAFSDHLLGPLLWLIAPVMALGGMLGVTMISQHPICETCDRYWRLKDCRTFYFRDEAEYAAFKRGLDHEVPGSPAYERLIRADLPRLEDGAGQVYLESCVYTCVGCGEQLLDHHPQHHDGKAWQTDLDAHWAQPVPSGVDMTPAFAAGPRRAEEEAPV